MEAIEGMRVALGPAILLSYCLQGLFHPARKAQEVYWRIYNSLYIGVQDGLVAAYPVLGRSWPELLQLTGAHDVCMIF
jgi:splicing factor 3B subunit 1